MSYQPLSIRTPKSMDWLPVHTVQDVLELMTIADRDGHNGPFVIFHNPEWDRWLDDDYKAVAPLKDIADTASPMSHVLNEIISRINSIECSSQITLRERLCQIDRIECVLADYSLTSMSLVLRDLHAFDGYTVTAAANE